MSEKYINGKGKLYFAPFITGTQTPKAERYLGNAPEVAIAFDVSYLDHFASTGGIKVKDQQVAIQVNRSGSCTLDSITSDNLSMLFFGTAAKVTTAASTVANEPHLIDALDRYIQLGSSDANPTGNRKVASVVVTNVGGVTTYAAGTDYTIDLALGRLYIPPTSTIAVNSSIEIDYSITAQVAERVISGTTPIEGSFRFIADNPAGENLDYFMPWVKLTPNGDFNLISDEWLKASFKLEVLKKGNVEAVFVDGRPF
jgi:hypothetical protein